MKIELIGGDEPYMIDMRRKQLIRKLQMPDLNFYKSDVLDEKVLEHLQTCPIVDEEKVAFVRLEHLREADNSLFPKLSALTSGLLIIQFQDYDGRSSFFKEVKAKGLVKLYLKENYSDKQVQDYLTKIAGNKGISFEAGAMELLLSRTCYRENEDVNLYTLIGYIKSLSALGNPIRKEHVCAIVTEYHSEDVFGIAKMILSKDLNGLRLQANLQKKNAIRTLSALLREYRIAYKAKYFPLKEIGVSYCVFSRLEKAVLCDAIRYITGQIQSIKTGRIPQDVVLLETFFKLASK